MQGFNRTLRPELQAEGEGAAVLDHDAAIFDPAHEPERTPESDEVFDAVAESSQPEDTTVTISLQLAIVLSHALADAIDYVDAQVRSAEQAPEPAAREGLDGLRTRLALYRAADEESARVNIQP